MNVDGKPMRTIWRDEASPNIVRVIDQRQLPHRLVIESIRICTEMETAIRDMHVRGAPLIGVAAAYGMALASMELKGDSWLEGLSVSRQALGATRPTAVNLFWALEQQWQAASRCHNLQECQQALWLNASRIAEADVQQCRDIGQHGLRLIRKLWEDKCKQPEFAALPASERRLNILTHCNAGWLACVDYGTATAPIYAAHEAGIPVHVWVDETRPRNQGAKLTAWELGQHGVPHTLIPDNAGGHLMQHGMVDMVITGADRVTRNGDAANKIGTYLKGLAAKDNAVPFHVAMPVSTIDWKLSDGIREIVIETRNEGEVRTMDGLLADGSIGEVLVCPKSTPAVNYGFDVTPARLITGLITERGSCAASEAGLLELYPEMQSTGRLKMPEGSGFDAGSALDGVIKFACRWKQSDCISETDLGDLPAARRTLIGLGLIGVGADGIGYGNLSMRRIPRACVTVGHEPISVGFLVTGSQTGHLKNPGPEAYSFVNVWDCERNWLECVGLCKASSESLSHAALYELSSEIKAVVHVHGSTIWNAWENPETRTNENIPYGTPAMALELQRIALQHARLDEGVLCMGGHKDGIIAWARSVTEATALIVDLLQASQSRA